MDREGVDRHCRELILSWITTIFFGFHHNYTTLHNSDVVFLIKLITFSPLILGPPIVFYSFMLREDAPSIPPNPSSTTIAHNKEKNA
jgi:hypothetical protein